MLLPECFIGLEYRRLQCRNDKKKKYKSENTIYNERTRHCAVFQLNNFVFIFPSYKDIA